MSGASHREAAIGMALAAGMSTGIGAAFVLFVQRFNRTLLAGTVWFESGA